ncbi:MAG: hypothetical protein WA874_02535 [Chryseosolibacter sp.]
MSMNFQGKPLTCKLTTPELQQRRATVIRELKELLLKKEEIIEGLQFTFQSPDSVLDKLLDFIKSERLCCDFFSFHLSVSGDTATLQITGPEGTKEFLEHEVGF